ncbi:MAG: PAS domain S-box protein, partial [Nitrospinota bacterium]
MARSLKGLSRAELGKIGRDIFDTAHCLVVVLDLDGVVVYLNRFGEDLLGQSPGEAVGKNWVAEFVPPEYRARLQKVIQTVRKKKTGVSGENELICKKGKRRRLAWTNCPVFADSGEVKGVAGIGIDVTQEYRIRKELEEKETRIRAALDNMVDGFIAIDERGVIESFNRAAERMFGYPAEEVVGRNVSLLMVEPHRSEHDGYIADFLRTGKARIIGVGREVVARRKDGSTFPVSLAVAEMRFGKRRMFVGNLRDLTEERELRSAAETEHRLRSAIVEGSADAILALDKEGRIVSWNPGAEAVLGYSAEEVRGRHFRFLIPPDLLKEGEVERLDEVFAEKGEIRDYPTRRVRKDGGEVQVLLSRRALRDEAGALIGYSSILRDVTEENRLREQLRQTEKLSAIGELAAGLAHEIGGPLSVISGNAEFLLKALEPGDPRREDVEGIAIECDAVASLIRRLLDFSRPAKLESRPVDVNECLRNILALVRKQIVKRRIEIKLDLQVGLPQVLGDPNQLEQVVMNLVLNARHAMPEGGRLEIRSFAAPAGRGKGRRNVCIQ